MKPVAFLFAFLFSFSFCLSQTASEKESPVKGITFSLPWVNQYYYVDHYKNRQSTKSGFFGIGISGYYKEGRNKVSFNVSLTEDIASPIAAIDYSKKDLSSSIGTSYCELIYHKPIVTDVNLIAGFNFMNYVFHLSSKVDTISSYKKTNQTLGISLGLEYRFNTFYSVAAVYRPAIASFETDSKYRHLINLEFRIDLDLKKKNK